MSKRSEALAVVPDSYRAVPVDEDYTGSMEVRSCGWCEFRSGVYCQSHVMAIAEGVWISRRVNAATRALNCEREGIEHDWLSALLPIERAVWFEMVEGNCPGYRPSLWTRLLRKLGLRRPVMR